MESAFSPESLAESVTYNRKFDALKDATFTYKEEWALEHEAVRGAYSTICFDKCFGDAWERAEYRSIMSTNVTYNPKKFQLYLIAQDGAEAAVSPYHVSLFIETMLGAISRAIEAE